MVQALAREISDMITIIEAKTGLASAKYFINDVSGEIFSGRLLRTRWTLAPAQKTSFWLLGTAGASELGTTTKLGF